MGNRVKVLIADDNDDVRDLLREALEDDGYQVSSACDGAEAVRLFQAEPADVVITDLSMPRENGLYVLAAVAASRPGTPVIVLTGDSADARATEVALQGGAFACLTKPLRDIRLLAQAVAAALAARPAGRDGSA